MAINVEIESAGAVQLTLADTDFARLDRGAAEERRLGARQPASKAAII
jgi:hypothetical protein